MMIIESAISVIIVIVIALSVLYATANAIGNITDQLGCYIISTMQPTTSAIYGSLNAKSKEIDQIHARLDALEASSSEDTTDDENESCRGCQFHPEGNDACTRCCRNFDDLYATTKDMQ